MSICKTQSLVQLELSHCWYRHSSAMNQYINDVAAWGQSDLADWNIVPTIFEVRQYLLRMGMVI